jgi:hypothetical protein
MWRRRGLVLVIYSVGLILAGLIGNGLYRALEVEIGPTGFSDRLFQQFDLVLWFDYWDGVGPAVAAVMRQAVLAGLLMMVWKVASSLGLIHALHGDATAGFWEGVRRFTLRGFGLAVLYLIPLVILIAVVVGAGAAMTETMGEVGTFWMWMAVLPLLVIGLVAMFDLFHDYARMYLVHRGATVFRAWWRGILWPFKRFRSILLYKLWLLISVVLWIGVLVLGFYLPDQSMGAVFVVFLLQQVLVVARFGATVSWYGAEVALFERFAPAPESVEAAGESQGIDEAAGAVDSASL